MIVSVDTAEKKEIQKESERVREREREVRERGQVEMGVSDREKISSLLILGRIIKQS